MSSPRSNLPLKLVLAIMAGRTTIPLVFSHIGFPVATGCAAWGFRLARKCE